MHGIADGGYPVIDALIIGAGPTGLTLACELFKRGLKVRIVDKLSNPTQESRALGIQSRTLELFEKMGLVQTFLKKGQILQHAHIYYEKQEFASIHFKHLPVPFPLILVLSQAETEGILTSHLSECGGSIERGVELISLSGSKAVLQNASGNLETVAARWIFGCDGAHSAVRHFAGIPFEGEPFPETFALADVELETELPHEEANAFIENERLCVFFPLPRKRWFRMIVQTKTIDAKSTPNLSDFQKIASEASPLPVKLLQSEWISTFTIHRRCASQMRKGNTFLLGDAAHIHSPVGGQGLNTSVQDAFNLAWKVALVHQGIASETLLDSYEQERFPVAKAVLESTSRATKIITSRFLKKLLFPLLRPLISTSCIQKKLLTAVSEIGVSYQKSSLICTSSRVRGGPKPGMRAPDAPLSYAGRLFQRLHPTSHTLLLFGEDSTLVEKISSEYSEVIDILHLDLQRESNAAKVYGATTSCCYLIRPDGYIAFCAKTPAATALLKYLIQVVSVQR